LKIILIVLQVKRTNSEKNAKLAESKLKEIEEEKRSDPRTEN